MNGNILKYIIKASIRDRIYISLLVFLIIAFCLSIFLGSTSFVEKAYATTAYIAGSGRIIISFGLILFVCITISRAFEYKEIEFILSKNISREKFILSYIGGFLLITILIILPFFLAILFLGNANIVGLVMWSISFFLEMVIIISFCILCSLITRNVISSILSVSGFYILSRMMGFLVVAVKMPSNMKFDINLKSFAIILKFLLAIFPRFDLFTKTRWISYGIEKSEFNLILIQSAIYIPLIIFMAFHDFRKKQF